MVQIVGLTGNQPVMTVPFAGEIIVIMVSIVLARSGLACEWTFLLSCGTGE